MSHQLTITIRRATQGDLLFLLASLRHETETLGFLPAAAVREYLAGGRVLLAETHPQMNTDAHGSGGSIPDHLCPSVGRPLPVGFCLFRISEGRRQPHAALPTGKHVKIIQVCVAPRWRRHGIGERLVRHVERIARRRKANYVSCWVAADLEAAGGFWSAIGFESFGWREGGARRRRLLRIFVLPLNTSMHVRSLAFHADGRFDAPHSLDAKGGR